MAIPSDTLTFPKLPQLAVLRAFWTFDRCLGLPVMPSNYSHRATLVLPGGISNGALEAYKNRCGRLRKPREGLCAMVRSPVRVRLPRAP